MANPRTEVITLQPKKKKEFAVKLALLQIYINKNKINSLELTFTEFENEKINVEKTITQLMNVCPSLADVKVLIAAHGDFHFTRVQKSEEGRLISKISSKFVPFGTIDNKASLALYMHQNLQHMILWSQKKAVRYYSNAAEYEGRPFDLNHKLEFFYMIPYAKFAEVVHSVEWEEDVVEFVEKCVGCIFPGTPTEELTKTNMWRRGRTQIVIRIAKVLAKENKGRKIMFNDIMKHLVYASFVGDRFDVAKADPMMNFVIESISIICGESVPALNPTPEETVYDPQLTKIRDDYRAAINEVYDNKFDKYGPIERILANTVDSLMKYVLEYPQTQAHIESYMRQTFDDHVIIVNGSMQEVVQMIKDNNAAIKEEIPKLVAKYTRKFVELSVFEYFKAHDAAQLFSNIPNSVFTNLITNMSLLFVEYMYDLIAKEVNFDMTNDKKTAFLEKWRNVNYVLASAYATFHLFYRGLKNSPEFDKAAFITVDSLDVPLIPYAVERESKYVYHEAYTREIYAASAIYMRESIDIQEEVFTAFRIGASKKYTDVDISHLIVHKVSISVTSVRPDPYELTATILNENRTDVKYQPDAIIVVNLSLSPMTVLHIYSDKEDGKTKHKNYTINPMGHLVVWGNPILIAKKTDNPSMAMVMSIYIADYEFFHSEEGENIEKKVAYQYIMECAPSTPDSLVSGDIKTCSLKLHSAVYNIHDTSQAIANTGLYNAWKERPEIIIYKPWGKHEIQMPSEEVTYGEPLNEETESPTSKRNIMFKTSQTTTFGDWLQNAIADHIVIRTPFRSDNKLDFARILSDPDQMSKTFPTFGIDPLDIPKHLKWTETVHT